MKSLIKRIREAIDYGDYPERMDPNLERKLSDPQGEYAQNPAFRKGAESVEKLAGERFKEVVDKLRRESGNPNVSNENVKRMIFAEMMSSVQNVMRIESRYKDQLEELAVEESLIETKTPSDWYIIEPYLNRSPIDVSNFRYEEEDDNTPPNKEDDEDKSNKIKQKYKSFDIEDLTDEEEFEQEVSKREIVNLLIQGSAKRAHYLFQKPEVRQKLDAIDRSLYRNYSIIMAANDYLYFTMENMIEQMSRTGQGVAGKFELDEPDGGDDDESSDKEGEEGGMESPDTVIKAYGMIFPILCHEIVKGIEEATARHSYSKNPEIAGRVLRKTDVLSKEPMQLRLGPKVVEKLRMALPDEVFEPESGALIRYFMMVLYQTPAKEFLKIFGDLIDDNIAPVSKKFQEILIEAKKMQQEFENDDDDQNDDYDPDDYGPDDEGPDDEGPDDFDSMLKQLGLSRSK